jgi:hypothetical protein
MLEGWKQVLSASLLAHLSLFTRRILNLLPLLPYMAILPAQSG